jgi:hypothetical protein
MAANTNTRLKAELDLQTDQLLCTINGEMIVTPLAAGLERILSVLETRPEIQERRATFSWTCLLGPHNCAVGERQDITRVVLVDPPHTREVQYARFGTETWTLPHLLWIIDFSTESRRHQHSGLFMVGAKPASILDATPVYAFPHGNVYAGGLICWGEVSPDITLGNPGAISSLFFGTRFNEDLTNWPGNVDDLLYEAGRAGIPLMNPAAGRHRSNRQIWFDLYPTQPLPRGQQIGLFHQQLTKELSR